MPAFLAAAAMVPAAFQFISGLKQARDGERMNPVRPVATANQSITQATGIAQNAANADMAGYGNAIANVRQNTASTVRAAQQSGSANNALAVIAAAGANENTAVNNLDTQNAKFKQSGQQMLIGQLGRQAADEQRVTDWNTKQKYIEEAGTKSALTQAGNQNMNNALGGFAAALGVGAKKLIKGKAGTATAGASAIVDYQADDNDLNNPD